ncbi:MAG: glutamate formimidoyltransferase, partial [Anaerolineae bacterium]
MHKIVECVPNFSEGRRGEVVEEIAASVRSIRGVKLLDVQMDADHNRSVLTFVGSPRAVAEAAFNSVARAAQLIDLDQHKGEHPRMGAADVVPFVPIKGVTMEECVQIARGVGERIGRELNIPVYLYEEAATQESRRNLADVRRGEYEGLKEEIESNPERKPDFGPSRLGKAGATAVGARFPLIAYNVNLETDDLSVAKAIARAVRHSSGGLRYVKALGLSLAERGIVQVSMNMTNYRKTPLFRVFEMIKREAARYGVPIIGSEIVGLTPNAALTDAAEFYLQLEDFAPQVQVLENRLTEEEPGIVPYALLQALAQGTPTPGGGSAVALASALAGALTAMVAQLTVGRKRYAQVEQEMEGVLERARSLADELADFIETDVAAYDRVLAAYRLPKGSEQERASREEAIQAALREAAAVPLAVADRAVKVMELTLVTVEKGNVNAMSDAGVAAYLAHAAVRGAVLNVRTNASSLKDGELASNFDQQVTDFANRADELLTAIEQVISKRMGG